jgi:hypothetical protein
MDIKNYKETRFSAVTGVTPVTFHEMPEKLKSTYAKAHLLFDFVLSTRD